MEDHHIEVARDFFNKVAKKAESMIIMVLIDGQARWMVSASPMEVSYMTDVVKIAIMEEKIEPTIIKKELQKGMN